MIVEFSKQATADLRKIAVDSRAFGNSVAAAVDARIREIIALIARYPQREYESPTGPEFA